MITVTEPIVTDMLRDYHTVKARLKTDAPIVEQMRRYTPDDTLDDMLLPSVRMDGIRVLGGITPDPTGRIAVEYYERFEQERDRHITPFIERYQDLTLLMKHVTDSIKELKPFDRALLQRLYIEHMPTQTVSVRMRLSKIQLYERRVEAIRRLTELVKSKYTVQEAS